MARPARNPETIAAFAFGVLFLTVMLVLIVWISTPTPAQFFVFRLTLALSAAGVGALLPGFLHFNMPLPMQGSIRAGGALALFASVWFTDPKTIGVEVIPPKQDARVLIEKFLGLSDIGDHQAAYKLYSKRTRDLIKEETYVSMGKEVRDSLGKVGTRLPTQAATPQQLQGLTAPFVMLMYQGTYEKKKGIWAEMVSTVAEDGEWRIYGYNVSLCQPPWCQPVDALLK